LFKFGKVRAQTFIKQFIRTIFLLILLKSWKKKKTFTNLI
jgi:hypothetical protein